MLPLKNSSNVFFFLKISDNLLWCFENSHNSLPIVHHFPDFFTKFPIVNGFSPQISLIYRPVKKIFPILNCFSREIRVVCTDLQNCWLHPSQAPQYLIFSRWLLYYKDPVRTVPSYATQSRYRFHIFQTWRLERNHAQLYSCLTLTERTKEWKGIFSTLIGRSRYHVDLRPSESNEIIPNLGQPKKSKIMWNCQKNLNDLARWQ